MKNIDHLKFGITKLDQLAVIHMDGDFDSVIQLLQGQVTSDCALLSPGVGQASGMCNEKGYVLCNFDIVLHEKLVLIIIPIELESLFIQEINKFSPFFKVSTQPKNIEVMGLLRHENESLLPNEHVILKTQDVALSLLLGSDTMQYQALKPIQHQNWLINRKILGDHVINLSSQGQYRPHELMQHLSRVSFSKGCFRGQEIIARMEYLGKQKTQTQLIVHSDLNNIKQYKIIGDTLSHDQKFFSSCFGKAALFS